MTFPKSSSAFADQRIIILLTDLNEHKINSKMQCRIQKKLFHARTLNTCSTFFFYIEMMNVVPRAKTMRFQSNILFVTTHKILLTDYRPRLAKSSVCATFIRQLIYFDLFSIILFCRFKCNNYLFLMFNNQSYHNNVLTVLLAQLGSVKEVYHSTNH